MENAFCLFDLLCGKNFVSLRRFTKHKEEFMAFLLESMPLEAGKEMIEAAKNGQIDQLIEAVDLDCTDRDLAKHVDRSDPEAFSSSEITRTAGINLYGVRTRVNTGAFNFCSVATTVCLKPLETEVLLVILNLGALILQNRF